MVGTSLRAFAHPTNLRSVQAIPANLNATPAAHEPASTHSIPMLRRKIAVAAAAARIVAGPIGGIRRGTASNDRASAFCLRLEELVFSDPHEGD